MKEWWDKTKKKLSKKLGYADNPHMIDSNGKLTVIKRTTEDTRFPKISENNVKDSSKELKTRKIELFLTIEQKELLKKWMVNARWLYNQNIDYIIENGYINKNKAQKLFLSNRNYAEENKWVLETSSHIRCYVISSLYDNYNKEFNKMRR